MNRQRLVDRAIKRWAVMALEPSKGSNVDVLDVIDRFNEHANSQLAGISVSEARLLSAIEEELKGAKVDKTAGRINGVIWRKPKEIKWEPRPSKSPEDSALETRLLTFLRDGSVFIQRGEKGFTVTGFANWRQSWFYGGYFHLKHDRIDHDTAEEFLKRSDLVRWDDESKQWFVKV